jgi:photosystem II stability/assembly factor-like uncharacterized protein
MRPSRSVARPKVYPLILILLLFFPVLRGPAALANSQGQDLIRHQKKIELQERRAESEYRKRAFPLGSIPSRARERALSQTLQAEAIRPKSLTVYVWYNIGPAPIVKSPYGGPGSGPCSGRISALAVDPTDADHHWLIGTAQGGIWETTDGGSHWTARTDDQASLAIGAIAFAPSSVLTVYAGTGEPNFRGDDYAGAGLLISHDRGTHWQMLNNSFAQTSFSRIQVNANNISNLVVATVRGGAGVTDAASGTNFIPGAPARGVFLSGDGGASFTRVLTGEATDLRANPGNFNQQYAGLGEIYGAPTNGIYRTTNGWATSQLINGPWTALAPPAQIGRISLAIADGHTDTVYVGLAERRTNYLADLIGIWRSDNAWSSSPTWTQIPNPPVVHDYAYSPRYWYHFSLLVDPDDQNKLYLTEFNVWRHTSNWVSIASNIHPDNHVLAFEVGPFFKRLLLGNDGGVWLSDTTISGSWQNLNNGLAITQIYRGAVDPRPKGFLALAGTQDNGTPANSGSPGWPFIEGADGGDCAISRTNPDTDWALSYDVQNGESDLLRTVNGGLTRTMAAGELDSDLLPDYQQFYIHFEKSPRNDNLFIAGTSRLWRCDDFFSGWYTWSINSPQMLDAFGAPTPISAMAFAPSDNTGMVYAFGTEDGQLRLTTNGGTSWNDLDSLGAVPQRYISGLAFSPTDQNVLYVTLSGFDEGTPGHPGHVFRTGNALASNPGWMDVSPPVDLPINCIAINPIAATNIFVGSDIGVWSSSDGAVSWFHHGPSSGMPNVAVFDLRMNSIGQPTAFTHGRSAFTYTAINIPIIVIQKVYGCLSCPPAPCLQCPPDEMWLNPGDLVTIGIPLQNISPYPTANLTATLLASSQITPVSGSQNYGSLPGQSPAVTRNFSFRANLAGGPGGPLGPGACGDTVQAVFQLQDGSSDLGQVTMSFRLGVGNHPFAEIFDEVQPPALPPGWVSTASGAGLPWITTTNPPANVPGGDPEDQIPPSTLPSDVNIFIPDVAGQSSVTTPPFIIGSTLSQLFFLQAFSVSNAYDGCILEISVAGQAFQEITQAGGTFAQGGYNRQLNDFNPLGLRPAWSGDSGGWQPTYVRLSASAVGQTAQLRWHFAGARGSTNGFWFLDTVQVTDTVCLPPVTNPVIINPALRNSSFTFDINTVTGRTYIVEYKTNLNDSVWQFLQNVNGNGTQQTVGIPITSSAQAFYRFRVH